MNRVVDETLFEASRWLSGQSVDDERTLAIMARLAVPRLADGCVVHLRHSDGHLRTVATVFDDPAIVTTLDDTARPVRIEDAHGPGRVVRTGISELVKDVASLSGNGILAGLPVETLGVRSYLCVPISCGDVAVGALTLVHTQSGRTWSDADLPAAQEVARRAGQGIENARRFERERSAREGLMRLSEITAALAKPSLSLEEVATTAIDGGQRLLGADHAIFFDCQDPGMPTALASRGRAKSESPETTPIADLARSAIRTREVICFGEGAGHAWNAGIVVPLATEGEVLGVVAFGFEGSCALDEADRAFVDILALHSAQAFARAKLLARERRYNERVKILADAGELLAGPLDVDTTIGNVGRIAIPVLADLVIFDLVEEDGSMRRVSATKDPEIEAKFFDVERFPPEHPYPPDACPVASGRTSFTPVVDEAWVKANSPSAEFYEVLKDLGLTSVVSSPLVSGGEMFGAISICYSKSGRHHTEDDIALAEELARRVAVALRNARLYRLSQQAAHRAEEAARQAEEASRLKDEFLATVSHELRTPLSAILGWSSLLRRPRVDGSFVAKGLEVIERNARSQQRLIEDILDVSRIVTGKLRLDTEPVDLAVLAKDVLESVRPTAFAKSIAIAFDAQEGAHRLAGDSGRLRQVLWNLLSNAVKFTPNGGRVWLEIEQSGDRIVVRVRDTGLGIDAAFLPHVFERFRQADSSTTREHGGLGLGLAIVRHLTEMHGGSVEVKSPGANQGSTFVVTLPVRPFSAPIVRGTTRDSVDKLPTAPASARARRLEGMRIVVVEDEPDSRDLIALLLETEGAVVHTAESAEATLTAVVDFDADVVLSDIGMPGHDGHWLARELRHHFPNLPAIALTAYSSREDVARAMAAGFVRHVAKPVDPEQLVHALRGQERAVPVAEL